jgi:hypothetical protein
MQKCKAAGLHFCTFSWESWHNWQCKTAKMLKHARTQTLHFSTFSGTAGMGKARMWWLAKLQFCIFALLHFQLGELAQLAMQNGKNA